MGPPARQPSSLHASTRGQWRILHRWLGLFSGSWFALVGLSGGLLVFEDEIDAFLNPHLLTDTRTGPHMPPHAILARVADAFPLAKAERVRLPREPGAV